MKVMIKKGDAVRLSKLGYNGFYYPTEEKETLLHDVNAEKLQWVGSSDLIPVKVPESSVYGSGRPEMSVAVWVEKLKIVQ